MGIQCILNHFAMKTLILFCLFSISLSATDIELFSPAEDRTVCCLTATNNCASYCAGRSCTATCSVRCGILMSSCGTVTCSSVASSTCVAAPTPVPTPVPSPVPAPVPAPTPVLAPTPTCTSAGAKCMSSGSTTQTTCCTGSDCYPFGTSGDAYCVTI